MDYDKISKTELFEGISPDEVRTMLNCLQAFTRKYKKGEFIYHTGSKIDSMGFVLSGSIRIEQNDIWGSQSILDQIGFGQVFAETYAWVPSEMLMVDVAAAEEAQILFLKTDKVLKTCSSACTFHNRLIRNLLTVMASKNLNLTRKISHITPKSIRGRLISYLSLQAKKHESCDFQIPFNRQQLADYLCVDRSAMSNELGKMRDEGLLTFDRSSFHLQQFFRK